MGPAAPEPTFPDTPENFLGAIQPSANHKKAPSVPWHPEALAAPAPPLSEQRTRGEGGAHSAAAATKPSHTPEETRDPGLSGVTPTAAALAANQPKPRAQASQVEVKWQGNWGDNTPSSAPYYSSNFEELSDSENLGALPKMATPTGTQAISSPTPLTPGEAANGVPNTTDATRSHHHPTQKGAARQKKP